MKAKDKRTAELEILLRCAWTRLADCVCHGDPGSEDHRKMQALMEAIDEALPMKRTREQ